MVEQPRGMGKYMTITLIYLTISHYISLAQYCCNFFLLNHLELMSTELPAGEAIVRQPGKQDEFCLCS